MKRLKIMHCCLAGGYTEYCSYQENMLTESHRAHGHDVLVAASTESVSGGRFVSAPAGEIVTESGIVVKRLPYADYVPSALKNKLRFFPTFESIMENYEPDIIFFHSVASHELLTAAKYKQKHPSVPLLVDSHAALSNSAKNPVGMLIQHKLYYKSLYKRTSSRIDRLFYIGMEEKDYLTDVLGIEERRLEFLPLGGTLTEAGKKAATRRRVRSQLGITDNELLLCHTGKLSAPKRTDVLLRAMSLVTDPRLRLVIIGSAEGEILEAINKAAAEDRRITYLGWQKAEVMYDYLCASDMYVQPGKVSATLQNALCCGVPAISDSLDTYLRQFDESSGVIFLDDRIDEKTEDPCSRERFARSTDSLAQKLRQLLDGEISLSAMSELARTYAAEHLDYDKQAEYIESFALR